MKPGFLFNDQKIVIKDEMGLKFKNVQRSLDPSINNSTTQQIGRSVALKSREGLVSTTNYHKGLFV
jgi:hypothetical protein